MHNFTATLSPIVAAAILLQRFGLFQSQIKTFLKKSAKEPQTERHRANLQLQNSGNCRLLFNLRFTRRAFRNSKCCRTSIKRQKSYV